MVDCEEPRSEIEGKRGREGGDIAVGVEGPELVRRDDLPISY